MSSFWDGLKDKAAWAAEQIGEKIDVATEAGKTEFEVLKVRRQADAIQDEIEGLYGQLGKRAYELWQSEKLDDSEAKGIGAEIHSKQEKIEELKAEVEQIRLEHEESLKKREEEAKIQAEEEDQRRQDKEEGIDGEAVWEDDGDDGTPPPP
jgi:hypothetical protein